MNPSKIAYLFVYPNRCWHEFKDFNSIVLECVHCHKKCYEDTIDNPDLTHWEHFGPWLDDFTKHEAWDSFEDWAFAKYSCSLELRAFLYWILHFREHFLTLFREWLSLQSTQDEFGWVECPRFKKNEVDVCDWIDSCSIRNEQCVLDGKIKAPWLKAWEESNAKN